MNSSTIVSKIHHTRINGLRKTVPVAEGSSETTTEREKKRYLSTVDACPECIEMWKAIESLNKVNHQMFQRSLKQFDIGSFGKFTSTMILTVNTTRMAKNEVNEIRAERLARTANPLALVAQQQPVYHKPATVTEDDEMSKEKEIDKPWPLNILSRKNVGYPIVQKSGFSVYNCREIWHVNQGNSETKTTDWKDDTDDESEEQELEAHYMYMAQIQEVTPDTVDNSGPIFDDEPMHKVQNNNDNYNVFAMENEHPEQPESTPDDQDETDNLDQERDLLASLIQKLKCEIDDSKNRNKFLESSNKELVDKLKDLKKFPSELDKYNDVKFASSFAKPEFLKKAQRANPRLYDIGCYNDNLALMLAPDSDETIRLEKKRESKLTI
ncbi:hypothetical protein Tco_0940096 [Tanacetum coccineum]|uniref:Uncharacterized protein n=1 Tax=Tanacetum coccineum TaxID=301880 RepID=A0ABQ5DPN1_9ASTR